MTTPAVKQDINTKNLIHEDYVRAPPDKKHTAYQGEQLQTKGGTYAHVINLFLLYFPV